MAVVTSVDLYAFGNRGGPRPPRASIDVFVDASGMVGPESPPFPGGASLLADPFQSRLHGHYHVLPKGTVLPDELAIIADGSDVDPNSRHGPTHHTLYPVAQLAMDRFTELFVRLPWQYAGKK